MEIATVMGQDQVGIDVFLEVFKKVFDLAPQVWEVAVAKRSNLDRLGAGVAEESTCAGLRLLLPGARALNTIQWKSASGYRDTSFSTVPPQPISMSSAWAPRQRTWRTTGKVALSMGSDLEPRLAHGTTRGTRSRVLVVPQLPGW